MAAAAKNLQYTINKAVMKRQDQSMTAPTQA